MIDVLASVRLKVGDVTRRRIEEDGPLKLHRGAQLRDRPPAREGRVDVLDESGVGEEGVELLRRVFVARVEGGEDRGEEVDGCTVSGGEELELAKEEEEVVGRRLPRGADEKEELRECVPLLLVSLDPRFGRLVREGGAVLGCDGEGVAGDGLGEGGAEGRDERLGRLERLNDLLHPGSPSSAIENDLGALAPRELVRLLLEQALQTRRDESFVRRQRTLPDGLKAPNQARPLVQEDVEAALRPSLVGARARVDPKRDVRRAKVL